MELLLICFSYDIEQTNSKEVQSKPSMHHRPPSRISQVRLSIFSQGPITEQYLAEEALGLAKSLGWYVLPGPYWDNTKKRPITPIPMKANHLYIEADP